MDYLNLKALHIIFVVTWFAALFYIVRLFIYHTEAQGKEPQEREILSRQFLVMECRLWYIIAWPSMVLTMILGSLLLYEIPSFLKMPWMHIKLTFIVLLVVYHHKCHFILKQMKQGIFKHSSFYLRVLNEITTIILVAIVFLVVLKDHVSWIYGTVIFILVSLFLFFIVKRYKFYRKKNNL